MKPGVTSRRTICAACCASCGRKSADHSPIAEQLRDQRALGVVLVLGDGIALERLDR